MIFSKRHALALRVDEWLKRRNIPNNTFNVVTALSDLCALDENEYDDLGNLIVNKAMRLVNRERSDKP